MVYNTYLGDFVRLKTVLYYLNLLSRNVPHHSHKFLHIMPLSLCQRYEQQ